MIATVTIVALLVFLVIGVPVGFAMALSGMLGLYLIGGVDVMLGIVSTTPVSQIATYELVVIPMFVVMAEFIVVSGAADGLFESMRVLVGRVRGGLAMATALAGAGFAALCGSSTIAAATLASTSMPAMSARGYDRRFSGGVVAISGTLSMLIPPSIALVLYSLLADVDIARMLIAGVVPGVIITITILATISYLLWRKPELAPFGEKYSLREKISSVSGILPTLVLVFAVTGCLYLGIATPTEVSAIGAFGALCIAVYAKGRGSFAVLYPALASSVRTTAMVTTIVIGAHIFSYALTLTQTTQTLANVIGALDMPSFVIICLITLFLLVLGFFMEQLAILTLTVPIFLPIVTMLGYDPIWFGIIMVITAEVGMVTPPVGMNVFVISRYTGQPVGELFRGVLPHVVAHLIALIVFLLFPQIILWVPNHM